jgi:transcription antitermination factor NusG
MKKRWYAVYTKSRAEKKVLSELEFLGIDAYLPLTKQLRQWSDRKKWVEVPLISGYVFVFIGIKEHDMVLNIPGVAAYVRFEGKAAIIPDSQIDLIRRMLFQPDLSVEVVHERPLAGDKVEVTSGAMVGLRGTLLNYRGKQRVVVEISQMNLSLIIELPLSVVVKELG